MAEHRVATRVVMTRPRGQLRRPECRCGERGPLTPQDWVAACWASEHENEVRP